MATLLTIYLNNNMLEAEILTLHNILLHTTFHNNSFISFTGNMIQIMWEWSWSGNGAG